MTQPTTNAPSPPTYPTRKEILILIRDILDNKPAACKLLQALITDLELSTLTLSSLIRIINNYVATQPNEPTHHH
ncbi:hypothetical protein LCGC14_1669780 [marine sediment metagenome]|uniref:Uncharacterized protein n=1 Tax=marine sediment metagenome TaxID=412755 RepID=A0A0F9K7L0_9ZZZZ